jgi:tetratricopeptide (TPR) repeat protein
MIFATGMKHTLLPLFIPMLLLLNPAICLAVPDNSDPAKESNYGRELVLRGEYEKGLEQLRRAYSLFPLNENLKKNLAEGYTSLGVTLLKQRRYEQADENFVKAQELYPEEPGFSLMRGICNYYLKKYDIARYELETARRKKGDSSDILYYLGLALYETEERQQAMDLWEKGLKLEPGRKELVEVLKKARKETAVEARMDQGHSSRFDLTYDPGVDTDFALAILDVLESASNQVGSELGHFPEARVPVAIYKRADFKTVTDSPDWSGGVYDGKIRLPFGAMKEITPPMRGVLYHEYAHAVVFDLTRGNCPLWLNEGIAQMFELTQFKRPITRPDQAGGDFKKLETSFSKLSADDAALAYRQSYSMVNYIVATYGWHRVKQILVDLGEGMKIDEAVADALSDYSLTYDGLIREWNGAVAGKSPLAPL